MDKESLSTRQKVRDVGNYSTLQEILNNSTLSELDKKIVIMHYVEEKNFGYIGDELGYSESGIKKRHKRILNKLGQLL